MVVKLGTITAEGSTVHADCYSYAKDEDGPVKIPNLKELLAKRGIQVAGLQKTEKSTAELEVELNAVSGYGIFELAPRKKRSLCSNSAVCLSILSRIMRLMQSLIVDPSLFPCLDLVYKDFKIWEIVVI